MMARKVLLTLSKLINQNVENGSMIILQLARMQWHITT